MQAFTIPAWVWMNAAVLMAAGGYVAARLAMHRRAAAPKALGTPGAPATPQLAP